MSARSPPFPRTRRYKLANNLYFQVLSGCGRICTGVEGPLFQGIVENSCGTRLGGTWEAGAPARTPALTPAESPPEQPGRERPVRCPGEASRRVAGVVERGARDTMALRPT